MATQLDSEVKRGEELDAQKALLQMQVAELGEQLEQLAQGKNLPDGLTRNIRVISFFERSLRKIKRFLESLAVN